MVWLVLISGIGLTAYMGLPVGVGLGLTGLVILHFFSDGATALAFTSTWNIFNDFLLSAVPMFILMGEILLGSGVSGRLYNAVAPLFQRIPGGLLHTNIAVSALFGSVSGTSTSTAAAIGSVAFPELSSRGYDRKFVIGSLAAGGTLGLLIPPSISLLLYGATQGVSIGKLFLAGILPGILAACMFMIYIFLMQRRYPHIAPRVIQQVPIWTCIRSMLEIWPVAILVFVILGTIYLGVATPTEAASLGVVASVVVGYTWGDLTLAKLKHAVSSALLVFAMTSVIMWGAVILAQSVSVTGLPSQLMALIQSAEVSPLTALALVCVAYLVLGCFFDGISLMLMTIPVVFPVLTGLGFDAVWLGVIITMLIEIGMITPPIGMNLFVLVAITKGEVTLPQAALAAVPYWFLLIGLIMILTAYPGIVTFIPNFM